MESVVLGSSPLISFLDQIPNRAWSSKLNLPEGLAAVPVWYSECSASDYQKASLAHSQLQSYHPLPSLRRCTQVAILRFFVNLTRLHSRISNTVHMLAHVKVKCKVHTSADVVVSTSIAVSATESTIMTIGVYSCYYILFTLRGLRCYKPHICCLFLYPIVYELQASPMLIANVCEVMASSALYESNHATEGLIMGHFEEDSD